MPWEDPPPSSVRCHAPYDMLVASDVAFCADLLPHLFKTMSWLCSHKTVAVIAIVDRPGEAAAFEAAAEIANWHFKKCLTHELSTSGFKAGSAREEELMRVCADFGGYRIIVYELKKVM